MMQASRSDVAAMLVAGLALAVALVLNHRFIHDDAFISLRYARNFAEHGQLVWNLGERVEGYTNFLFVVLSAGLIKFGVDPALAARSLNVIGAALVILGTARAARVLFPARPALRWAMIVAAGGAPPLAVWVLGGLETPLLAGLIAMGTAGFLAGRHVQAGLWFSLAVLTRLDAAVYIGAVGAALLVGSEPFAARFKRAFLAAGIPALVALIHMAWRYIYYSELLPLTFFAKTGLPLGVRVAYVGDYLRASLWWTPLLLTGAIGALVAVRPNRPCFPVSIATLAAFAYVIWTGGDHMTAARLILPYLMPLTLLTVTLIPEGRAETALAGLVAVAALTPLALKSPLEIDRAAFTGRAVGEWLDRTQPPGTLVALHTAGSTPFYAPDLRFIDMLGLNDPVIARRDPVPQVGAIYQNFPGHGKGDGSYVLTRKPDIIIAGNAEGNAVSEGFFVTDVELAANPDFARCYELRSETIRIPDADRADAPSLPGDFQFNYYAHICDQTEKR